MPPITVHYWSTGWRDEQFVVLSALNLLNKWHCDCATNLHSSLVTASRLEMFNWLFQCDCFNQFTWHIFTKRSTMKHSCLMITLGYSCCSQETCSRRTRIIFLLVFLLLLLMFSSSSSSTSASSRMRKVVRPLRTNFLFFQACTF